MGGFHRYRFIMTAHDVLRFHHHPTRVSLYHGSEEFARQEAASTAPRHHPDMPMLPLRLGLRRERRIR
jgi:hypothetical protein